MQLHDQITFKKRTETQCRLRVEPAANGYLVLGKNLRCPLAFQENEIVARRQVRFDQRDKPAKVLFVRRKHRYMRSSRLRRNRADRRDENQQDEHRDLVCPPRASPPPLGAGPRKQEYASSYKQQ